MKYFKIIYLFTALYALSSCSKFLDVVPDKSGNASIYNMDQLVNMMGDPSLTSMGSYTWIESIFASDDCDIRPYVYIKNGVSDNTYGVSVWNMATYETTTLESCTWKSSYKNMFTYNTVLENLDKVTQTSEQEKEAARGEALFGRAYTHFMALVTFCRLDMEAPGIGYKMTTAPTDIPSRETVQYTVDHILADLDASETALTKAGKDQFEPKRTFRISLPTLYAFRARVELYLGNYDKAKAAAEKALAAHNTLVDINTNVLYKVYDLDKIAILNQSNSPTGQYIQYREMKDLLYKGKQAMWEYEELYYPHTCDLLFSNRCVPISKDLYDLFDKEHDGRWIKFYNNNYMIKYVEAFKKSGTINGFSYENQQNLEEWQYHVYHRFVASSGTSGKYYLVGMTTAEMMLIKAECLARAGKTADAKKVLQDLRLTRFTTAESANNIGGTLKDVLDERRREMTSVFRWYDIKRLNAYDNANISIKKTKLSNPSDKNSSVITVELKPNDPFFAIPIPPNQILLMGWEQNEY